MKILVVEDEKMLADSLKTLFESKGFEVDVCYDGISGAEYGKLGVYDLLILDVMMPGLNGFELTKVLRTEHISTPILMLTARSDIDDRIHGLDTGADYYLTKPFDSRELLACVNALLRRQGDQLDILQYGNTNLVLSLAELRCGDEEVRLSAKEFEIMRMLMQAGAANVPKEKILVKVWGYDSEAVDNNVEVYIGFLRKKLKSIGSNVKIEAIRRLGYHLEVNADD